MRLLKWNTSSDFCLTEHLPDNIPPYVILSHTWGSDEDEVTFADIENHQGQDKAGYKKIQFCAQQAKKNGIEYFWVDTCCINKKDHVELSEAITSMFRWYKEATICFVYLTDVALRPHASDQDPDDLQVVRSWKPAFRKSRWFTRGWTLQELIAPDEVVFFSQEGERLGSKSTLEELIHEITTIPRAVLRGQLLSQVSVTERLRWANGRSTKKKEDQAYCLLGIFNVFMPLLYGEGSNAFVRLKEEINKSSRATTILQNPGVVALNPEASSLPTHQRPNDRIHSNRRVEHVGDECVSVRDYLLASLNFEQMGVRQSTVKGAYSTTCEWLLKHPAYLDWIDAQQVCKHHGFLWINGKPGAGKSTLMKFIHAYTSRTKLKDDLDLAFFFNARGDVLEKSTLGMYRALLYELMQKAKDLQGILDHVHISPSQPLDRLWTLEVVRELLSTAMKRLGRRRLRCFIDALDECDEEQAREMVSFFEDIGSYAFETGTQIYVCFASRHYPTITIRNAQKLILEDECGHMEDLARYVQNHLHAGKGKYIEEIRTEICKKSNGVFMWAVLVVGILNKEFGRGRIFAVQKRLHDIPTQLSDLFKDIFRRDNENMDELLLCLQWVLFAKRPLRREEFYFAMLAAIDSDNLTEWNPDYVTMDDIERFVVNSSKGLAELTKSEKAPTVQFIHESVRDFLIRDGGLQELWPEVAEDINSFSHNQLKHCCHNYLSVGLSAHVSAAEPLPRANSNAGAKLRKALTTKFPFLEYASRYLIHHANEAANSIPQDEYLQDFPIASWVNVLNILESYDIYGRTPEATIYYVFAEDKFPRLTKTTTHQILDLNTRWERCFFPLFEASKKDRQNIIRALKQRDNNVSTEQSITRLQFSGSPLCQWVVTPLIWALHKRHFDVAEALVTSSHDGTTKSQKNPVSQNKGNDVEARDDSGMTALLLAVEKEREPIVRLLLAQKANIEAKDKLRRTALMVAAANGNEQITQLLFRHNADIEATDSSGRKPLSWASSSGKPETVQLFLDRGADIEAKENHGRTVLSRAASSGSQAVVQLLLDRGANISTRDKAGHTALFWAARYSNQAVVQFLLDRGADIETRDNSGRTALFWAAHHGNLAVIQLLLDRGANIEGTDDYGRSVLSPAVSWSNQEVTQLLAGRGAKVEKQEQCPAYAPPLGPHNTAI